MDGAQKAYLLVLSRARKEVRMNVGQPLFFNLDVYYSLIDMYISADEVETALYLIDHPPAYYRDNTPERLREIKERLNKQLWTPIQYRGIYDSVEDNSHWPRRADVLANALTPRAHVMEYGPGSMWLRDGLIERGHNITYEYVSLDKSEFEKEELPNAQKVFVAFEIIEHLSDPWEIYRNYLKFDKPADIVAISTPLYTYAGGLPNWQDRPLGHLRAYTPNELHAVVSKMFVGYNWSCDLSDTITLVGKR